MEKFQARFDEAETLHALKHFLPAQAPLKDFIHHNTLHAFQHLPFHEGVSRAAKLFGYRVYLPLAYYRDLYAKGEIPEELLKKLIAQRFGLEKVDEWLPIMLEAPLDETIRARIGSFREQWKRVYRVNLDAYVHPLLFRIVGCYLDQGVSIWDMPVHDQGLVSTVQELERRSFVSFFRTPETREQFLAHTGGTEPLLDVLVGDPTLYEQYLFDQQFAHQGWSGIVSAIEDQPNSLVDARKIELRDLLVLELFLELDTLRHKLGNRWKPLAEIMLERPLPLFAPTPMGVYDEVCARWQEALEWRFYDEVLAGIQRLKPQGIAAGAKSMQAVFCIDDRECSIRRSLETCDPQAETLGTAGFFGVPFYYQPEFSKTVTKVCPAPMFPKHLIRELESGRSIKKDAHFSKRSNTLVRGYIDSMVLGAWSGIRLMTNVFVPTQTSASTSSSQHMLPSAALKILRDDDAPPREDGLFEGFTVAEMAGLVENLLRSIGLVEGFAPLVYFVGHGASSTNNTHYAGYDCGACSGRPGSVNARVAAFMLNHPQVRALLAERGISIPDETQFVGVLHDTTRDEMTYYDVQVLSEQNTEKHRTNESVFSKALALNAKERSRRFEHVDTSKSLKKVHQEVKRRSVSLAETRPELNHATNALCIVGRRSLSRGLYLDRRSFLNSYDYRIDPNGDALLGILRAVAPVCGGINLEYYFSRVDNNKLGAGTKLPHNVMGLIAVANGMDGDLRPGLPFQMVEVHDPLRLLIIVEQDPAVVLRTIQRDKATYEWIANEWVRLVAVHPEDKACHLFGDNRFAPYLPLLGELPEARDMAPIWETQMDNIPVHLLQSDDLP